MSNIESGETRDLATQREVDEAVRIFGYSSSEQLKSAFERLEPANAKSVVVKLELALGLAKEAAQKK